MPDSLPLIMLPEGKSARISRIIAGRGLLRRLTEMGFVESATVKILRSDRGCLIVFINGAKYALSKGIAMKIMVENS